VLSIVVRSFVDAFFLASCWRRDGWAGPTPVRVVAGVTTRDGVVPGHSHTGHDA
jgi:hypothetical protein